MKELVAHDLHKPILSRLKLLAHMDITETRKPQDGRISVRADSRIVDLRVSTLPAKFGEKVVMRILDAEVGISDLSSLIVVEKMRQTFSQMVHRPQGLVLVSGPTGSGKTTTLYSALAARCRPELNVVTVEDPIEYHLDGVTQVQVHPEIGTTFSLLLRGLLRQDPDVIMIGELRDRDTARMATEASMTGHLVLSSVHSNGAVDAAARLVDLGVERHAVANGLVGVLHQRLVRRTCASCAERFEYPEPIMVELYRAGAFREGEAPKLTRSKGCAACGGTGFRGRIALYELLVVTEPVRDAIAANADLPTLRSISATATIGLSRYAGVLLATTRSSRRRSTRRRAATPISRSCMVARAISCGAASSRRSCALRSRRNRCSAPAPSSRSRATARGRSSGCARRACWRRVSHSDRGPDYCSLHDFKHRTIGHARLGALWSMPMDRAGSDRALRGGLAARRRPERMESM